MKIAILSCFYPYRGGVSQFNASLYGELGKQHTVRAFNFKRQYPDFLFPGKTQYVTAEDAAVPIKTTSLLDTANPFTYISTAREIRKWDPDILILRYWMSYFGPSLGYVARHMSDRCKVVVILDNVIPHEPHFFDKPFTRYFLSGVDGCITLSKEVAADLERIKPGTPHRILPHPLYTHFGDKLERPEAAQRLGIEPGLKTILFFGLIRDYKGLDILLEAFRGLDESYQLVIAGESYGPFDKYQKQIDSIPGKDRIHVFQKYIGDAQVKDYFSAADVTVLPYRTATQSGVSALSYHFSVPVIVTDVGGLKEMIESKGTGLVADRPDADSTHREIERFFADDKLRQNCIENIDRECKRLSWSNFCSDLLDFAETLEK